MVARLAQRMGLFYGWCIVAAGGILAAVAGGTFFFGFSALFEPIIREFGWSRAATSVAYSLRAEVGGLEAPVIGVLLDRFGPRRVMRVGLLLLSLGMFIIAATQNIWMFYGGFIVATVGMGACGGLVGMMAITRWFRRLRGRALALMTVGNGLGGLMVPIIALLILSFDWRTAVVVAGVYILAAGLPLTYVIVDQPARMGLAPDGDPPAQHPEADPPDGSVAQGEYLMPGAPAEQSFSGREALKTRSFWMLALALAFIGLSGSAVTVHLVPFFTHVGMPDQVAALGMTALAIISLVGRLGFGFAADTYDKRYVMAAAIGMQALGSIGLALVQNVWSAALVLAVLSPGFGGTVPVRPALQAEYFGVRSFGAIQGMLMAVSTFGGAVGPVLAGWVFDVTGGYQVAWVFLGTLSLGAVPLLLAMGRPRSLADAGAVVLSGRSPGLPDRHAGLH
ncbi:MAG: MFS transporter [Chloroflexi bacterium]|nr:MFS transporter [Chloroflexota bacterium]